MAVGVGMAGFSGFDLRQLLSKGGKKLCVRKVLSCYAKRCMGAGKQSVFPPALFEEDRGFLESVRMHTLTETEKVGCAAQGPSQECYVIYSNVFDKIIEYITAYKNILTSIKQEYEVLIRNGQRNAFFRHGRLKALESESTTVLYDRKRAMEPEDKLVISNNVYNASLRRAEQYDSKQVQQLLVLISLQPDAPCSVFFFFFLFPSFSELLSNGQYDAAVTHTENSLRGILCNEAALKYLKSVSCLQGKNLPLLKYFGALINSSTAAGHFPNSAITLEAIKCAWSEKQFTVTHWVEQQRLIFSEAAGDVIFGYGKVEPSNESKCLALAQVTYGQSGAHKKVVLCLRKLGRTSGAMGYIQQLEHFSSGLTVILNDTVCTLEDWSKIEVACAENKHEKLSQKMVSILTSQDGAFENSPLEDEKDARIMEHVCW
ncbi:LOW QUALITY PROTEIN: clathrin heavy chain linker domain-containing protein 1 [Theristicus caerulescens]